MSQRTTATARVEIAAIRLIGHQSRMSLIKSITLDDKKLGGTSLDRSAEHVRSEAEEAFLERLRDGDALAFDQLVTRYSGDIYGLLYRITRDPEEARDLTQETFLRAYRSISGFRGDASVKTWLYRIAINQSRNRFRWWKRRKKDKTVSLDSPIGGSDRNYSDTIPSAAPNPEDEALRREQGLRLQKAIAELPGHFREAIVLCDVQGFAYEEIASILEINIGTVKSRISRGRRELREKLRDI